MEIELEPLYAKISGSFVILFIVHTLVHTLSFSPMPSPPQSILLTLPSPRAEGMSTGLDWSGCKWHGGADALQKPDGHGVLAFAKASTFPPERPDACEYMEGVMAAGRKEGKWISKSWSGKWSSYQYEDDDNLSSEVWNHLFDCPPAERGRDRALSPSSSCTSSAALLVLCWSLSGRVGIGADAVSCR